MRASAFDHLALWVDERDALAAYLCDVCGMRRLDRSDARILVGGDAREGKLSLLASAVPRSRGVVERIVLRVPDLEACIERSRMHGYPPLGDEGAEVDGPAGVPLGFVQPAACEVAALDSLVLRVPDPRSTALLLSALGFHWRGERLEVADRHVTLRASPVEPTERPLLSHFALVVDSVDDSVREAERHRVVVERVVEAPSGPAALVVGPDEIMVEYVERRAGLALV